MTKFHKYLCDQVQEFLDTPTTKALEILLLSVPPRHGKSFTVTETLPSWFLGNNPTSNVIIASYESSFAEAFSRRNRDKFNTFVQDIWDNSKPNTNVQGVSLWETADGGHCRAAGLKAGITGHGAELFIIDDPIKSKEQADSEVVLAKIHDEMGPSVQSRIHPQGKLIVIQTRWVEGDVIGWIEANWEEYIWKSISLPFEYDQEAMDIGPCPLGRKLGDSLMGAHLGDDENKMPQVIRNTNDFLKSKKPLVIRSDGSRTWNALYQCRPSLATGTLYRTSWWSYYSRTEDLYKKAEYIGLSVDATFKNTETSDFVALELWILVGRFSYLWKVVNKRMSFVDTVAKIKRIVSEFNDIDELVIEDKANGSAIIDVLKYEDGMPPIVAVNPLGGKVARAQSTSNYIAASNAYLPDDLTDAEIEDIESDRRNVSGIDVFVTQHSSFPFGKHDDMVDSQTQIITRINKLICGDVPMPKRRHERFTRWRSDMWEDYEQLDDSGKATYISIYGAPEEWQDD